MRPPSGNGRRPSILVVDDSEAARYALTRVLRRAGFEVQEAATGQETVRLAAARPDLVILDVNLPDASGLDVCRRLKADPATSATMVLHTSATFVTSEDRVQGLDAGADGYLTTPIDPPELLATVKALLRLRDAERRLRASAREWQATFDGLGDGVALLDERGRVVRCNATMGRLIGCPGGEVAGQPLDALLADGAGARAAALFEETRAAEARRTADLRLGDRWFSAAIDPIMDDGHGLTGAVWIMSDVTSRNAAEEALRASARQGAAIADLGQRALAGADLSTLADAAARLLVEAVAADCAAVLERSADGGRLTLGGGAGWGHHASDESGLCAALEPQAVYTLSVGAPVVVDDLEAEARFRPSTHSGGLGVRSGVSVVIGGADRPLGVLGAYSARPRAFRADDVHLLQAMALVLATAIERGRAEAERARLSAEVAGERARLTAVLEQMPAGVVLAEAPSGRVVFTNARVEEICRRPLPPAEDVEGYRQWGGVHLDGRSYEPGEWPLARALRAGEVVTGATIEIVRGDGSRGTISANAAPIRDQRGRVVSAVLAFHDVTDEKRAERRLRFLASASTRLAASLDYETTLATLAELAVPEVADWCFVDLSERSGETTRRVAIAHADPARAPLATALRRLAFDRAGPHPIGLALGTGRSQLQSEVAEASYATWAQTREHARLIRELASKSNMWVPLVVHGRILGVLTFTITDSARRYGAADLALAEELARRAAVAIENARLYGEAEAAIHARDAFLARASHELRTPLTSALGTVRLLNRAMHGAIGASPETLVDMASRNLDRMLALVNDLLDASKLAARAESLALEPVALGDVVDRSVRLVLVEAEEKGIALRVSVPPALVVSADPFKLEQVLVNLLANAIKFTPAGGSIDVSAEPDGGRSVVVRVRDSGIGIGPGDLERIFEPFVRADAGRRGRPRGTGLGLAICRQIMALHEGEIWAESEGPGKGSTFALRVPTRPPWSASAGGRAPAGRAPAG